MEQWKTKIVTPIFPKGWLIHDHHFCFEVWTKIGGNVRLKKIIDAFDYVFQFTESLIAKRKPISSNREIIKLVYTKGKNEF